MEAVIRQFREMMLAALQESGKGTKRTSRPSRSMSAFGGKADMARTQLNDPKRTLGKADMALKALNVRQ